MVAITKCILVFLHFQKSVIVTEKEGKTISLEKDLRLKIPVMPSFANQIHFLKPHLLGKVLMAPAQLSSAHRALAKAKLLKIRTQILNHGQMFCPLFPSPPFPDKIL